MTPIKPKKSQNTDHDAAIVESLKRIKAAFTHGKKHTAESLADAFGITKINASLFLSELLKSGDVEIVESEDDTAPVYVSK